MFPYLAGRTLLLDAWISQCSKLYTYAFIFYINTSSIGLLFYCELKVLRKQIKNRQTNIDFILIINL